MGKDHAVEWLEFGGGRSRALKATVNVGTGTVMTPSSGAMSVRFILVGSRAAKDLGYFCMDPKEAEELAEEIREAAEIAKGFRSEARERGGPSEEVVEQEKLEEEGLRVVAAGLSPALRSRHSRHEVRAILRLLKAHGTDWQEEYQKAVMAHNQLWPDKPAPSLDEVSPE